jgi:folate-dependent phosphoribosylglycinamide formyltransferase PurN
VTLSLGWFTSARGAGSRAMFEAVAGAIADGTLDARFAAVYCNRDPGEDPATDEFFARVRAAGAPLMTRSSVAFRRASGGARSRAGEPLPAWRLEYDRAVEASLGAHPFDLGVLAGYMLIFEHEFAQRHALLNLHPALPGGPTGTWREVIRQLIRTRATESGVMLHLAIPEVDMGPVVAYCRYSLRSPALDREWAAIAPRIDALDESEIEASLLFAAIRAAGIVREAPLLVATLREFAAGRLRADGVRILDAAGAPATPTDLTREVDVLVTHGSVPGQ